MVSFFALAKDDTGHIRFDIKSQSDIVFPA